MATPRSGFAQMCDLVRKTTPGAEYWNDGDPVPDMVTDPPFGRCYDPVSVRIVPDDVLWHFFRYHKVANYVAAMRQPMVAG